MNREATVSNGGNRLDVVPSLLLAGVGQIVAGVIVLAALGLPARPGGFGAPWFVTVPVEFLVGAGLLLLMPASRRQVAASALGLLLGVMTLLKLIDIGFQAGLARPFDPVRDLSLLDDAVRLLLATLSPIAAYLASFGVLTAAATLVVAATLSVRLLARSLDRLPTARLPIFTVASVGWLTVWLAGVQVAPGLPMASSAESAFARDLVLDGASGVEDRDRFGREVATDAYASVPGDRLLTALRGKDVVVAVVESYGRTALEDPQIETAVKTGLDGGGRQLSAAGYRSRSGYLTSSTAGGGSWLAHATLLSGLWIDSQQRYGELLASDRLTLTSAFARAGWRTVAVAPGTTQSWPEGSFYGYQYVYDQERLDYHGPHFSWSPMPDQYVLAHFQRHERGPGHAPVMAVLELTSSHAPWTPVPTMIDWPAAATGAGYAAMAGPQYPPELILTRDPVRVRSDYARALGYSLDSIISYLRAYGDGDLVMIIVGDHQPSPVVTGDAAARDVPIAVVAKDPAVLDRLSGWGWSDGLRPSPTAPVWPMDAFRDRFLAAFGPETPTR